MKCDCPDWKYMKQLDEIQYLAGMKGIYYTGKIFKFCPWCGKPLKPEEEQSGGVCTMDLPKD